MSSTKNIVTFLEKDRINYGSHIICTGIDYCLFLTIVLTLAVKLLKGMYIKQN